MDLLQKCEEIKLTNISFVFQYNLMEPVSRDGVPRVLFDGEATEPRAYSTVHGAR